MIKDRRKRDHSNETSEINNETAETVWVVRRLIVTTGDNPNFNQYISNMYRSAANQLNAYIWMRNLLGFEEKKVLINQWLFLMQFQLLSVSEAVSHKKSINKFKRLRKRALRFLCNGNVTPYDELLNKSVLVTIERKTKRSLCVEIYKTLNNHNACFMK